MVEATHPSDTNNPNAPTREQDIEAAIGEQLRNQRKAHGISLVEVAEHTKIGKRYLEALEEGRFDVVPCETYIRGFLRAYAKYLEMEARYLYRARVRLGLSARAYAIRFQSEARRGGGERREAAMVLQRISV